MKIELTRDTIRQTIARADLKSGLKTYFVIQRCVAAPSPIASNADFRRQFNGFYRVRRSEPWQTDFYGLMDRALLARAQRKPLSFSAILDALQTDTGRCEASFASKLHATVDPDSPVIDSVLLRNIGGRLPWPGASDRFARIKQLYSDLETCFHCYIRSLDGQFLVAEFPRVHPEHPVTEIKMLDLVLWKNR